MNDDRLRLRQLIEQLRTQLAGSDAVDPRLQARLESALSDAEKALGGPAGTVAGEPIGNRLNEAAIDFEVSHPALAGTVSSIIDALGRMGI
jgi:hypothetical protein